MSPSSDNAGCSDITTPLPFFDEPLRICRCCQPKTAVRIVNFELMKPEMATKVEEEHCYVR